MYHLLTGLYAEWTKKERFNILLVGLAGVGKSCALEKIKSIYLRTPPVPPSRIAPTVGQNVFNLTLPSSHLHFWDLGGSPSVRSLWAKYFEESHALVWAVDARDWTDVDEQGIEAGSTAKGKDKVSADVPGISEERKQRREESWATLSSLLDNPSLEGIPILVLANKVDDCRSSSGASASPSKEEIAAIGRKVKRWLAAKMSAATSRPPDVEQEDEQGGKQAAGSALLGDTPGELGSDTAYEWEVIATSALDGTGLHDAVDWLYLRVQNVKR